MATDARATILNRIHTATLDQATPAAIDAEWHTLARTYRRSSTFTREELLHQLEDRLRDYDAGVYRTEPAGLPALIEQILSERSKHRLAIPDGLPAAWLAPSRPPSRQWIVDDRSGLGTLEACDGVLTSASIAISETGTIILQDAPNGQGRRALTLLPDYHLCIVPASTIVHTVPEAIARLIPTAALATTFFSGPSATADIEMTRIKGVHGPRFVDVILLLD